MLGNVYEWCWDMFAGYPADAPLDYAGPQAGAHWVFRGGGCCNDARHARAANRYAMEPGYRNGTLGFRPLRSIP